MIRAIFLSGMLLNVTLLGDIMKTFTEVSLFAIKSSSEAVMCRILGELCALG